MPGNCKGHTLIELMITMTLSILVIAALIPINTISLQSVSNVRHIEHRLNRLHQSITLLESDLKSTALSGCTATHSLMIDSLNSQPERIIRPQDFQWLSGYSNGHWFPQTPEFATLIDSGADDAIQLVMADLSHASAPTIVTTTPKQVVYVTNCLFSEISRAVNAILLKPTYSGPSPIIYPLQFIQYYVKVSTDTKTLYRQYLSRSGTTVNEPLMDDIDQFRIGYGERLNNNTIEFKPAIKVNDWNKIVAVYVTIALSDNVNYSVSTIVPLINHRHE